MDDSFGPFKRDGLGVVHFHKPVDGIAKLTRRGETGASQGCAVEDTEPAFHLIQPRAVCRSVVQMDIWVSLQPAILFGFVGVQVVQDHVNLAIRVGLWIP